MKVHLLENLISRFLDSELTSKHVDWYFPHEIVGHFHDHWSSPVPLTLHAVYDDCLRSEISQRWWKRDGYRPKEMMGILMDTDAELATIAWKDLSNGQASLDGRLSRFNYYCNDLLDTYRRANPLAIDTYHHQDAAIVSLYLAGVFPDKQSLYPGLDAFRSFCVAVGSPDIPVVDDLVRYAKVTNVVNTFLQRNELFGRLIDHRSQPHHKVKCLPFQCCYEVISFAQHMTA